MKKSIFLAFVTFLSLCGYASQKPAEIALGDFIAYSTRDGQVAFDGEGNNSVFTSALLKHLSGADDLEVMARKVRQLVALNTKGKQIPVTHSSLSGSPVLSQLRGSGIKVYALVIGNSAYVGSIALKNPVNDARAVSVALKDLGFEVTTLLNSKQSEFYLAFKEFIKNSAGSNITVVFYAGHGIRVQGEDFIVPVDVTADGLTEKNFYEQVISWDMVLQSLSSLIKVAFIDADRHNPFQSSSRSR